LNSSIVGGGIRLLGSERRLLAEWRRLVGLDSSVIRGSGRLGGGGRSVVACVHKGLNDWRRLSRDLSDRSSSKGLKVRPHNRWLLCIESKVTVQMKLAVKQRYRG
jgi:hypothetical protein